MGSRGIYHRAVVGSDVAVPAAFRERVMDGSEKDSSSAWRAFFGFDNMFAPLQGPLKERARRLLPSIELLQ